MIFGTRKVTLWVTRRRCRRSRLAAVTKNVAHRGGAAAGTGRRAPPGRQAQDRGGGLGGAAPGNSPLSAITAQDQDRPVHRVAGLGRDRPRPAATNLCRAGEGPGRCSPVAVDRPPPGRLGEHRTSLVTVPAIFQVPTRATPHPASRFPPTAGGPWGRRPPHQARGSPRHRRSHGYVAKSSEQFR